MKATPRPLIKWKSFWLGILVLGFFVWAWRDSFHKVPEISFRGGCVSSVGGGLVFNNNNGPTMTWRASYEHSSFLLPKWGMFQAPVLVRGQGGWTNYRDDFFPALEAATNPREFYRLVMENARISRWVVYLPHWLFGLLFLVPWVSFLAWRWRRQRILTKAHDAAPPP